MANAGVPKGSMAPGLGKGIAHTSGKVNEVNDSGVNSIGIPYGQTPGLGRGEAADSMNVLGSTARVVKAAPSNLMTGMSQNRGTGGNK